MSKLIAKKNIDLLNLIVKRINNIKNILAQYGFGNEVIESYLLVLLKEKFDTNAMSENTLQAIKSILSSQQNVQIILQGILEIYDVQNSKLNKISIQKEQATKIINTKKSKNKKKYKQKKQSHQQKISPYTRQSINFGPRLRATMNTMSSFQSSLSESLVKAQMLRDFINKKIILAELCQKKLDRIHDIQNIAFETF